MHELHGSAAETDITMPHEHSKTGIARLYAIDCKSRMMLQERVLNAPSIHLAPRQNAGQRNGK
jgi:hypothetical protein